MTTKALDDVLECKRTCFADCDNGEILKTVAPILMNAFKTHKFYRGHAVQVAAAVLAMIEHFDGETDTEETEEEEDEEFDLASLDDFEMVCEESEDHETEEEPATIKKAVSPRILDFKHR